MSISIKLISVSTLLLIVTIGLFGAMNSMQSRKIIDESATRLVQEMKGSLRKAGSAQLRLLAGTTQIALVQSDYSTLQSIAVGVAKQDERLTQVVVLDKSGTFLAHSAPKKVGKKASGFLKGAMNVKRLTVQSEVVIGGQKQITFTAPVRQDGARLGTVFLAYGLGQLQAQLKKAEARKKKVVASSLRSTLVVGLLTVLVGVLLAIIQGLRISRPIQALAHQANQIAGGDLQARVEIKSHDEIGLLGDRFNYMAQQVLVLMRESMAKAAMEKELEVASAVQSTLVPRNDIVDVAGMQLAGYFRPAAQCGGDWWNYYHLEDGRLLVIIGDVTGHGVAPAMITAAAMGAASTVTHLINASLELETLLGAMNVAIHGIGRGDFVMTCFASIYDPTSKTLTFSNAGHNFPYLFRKGESKLVSLVMRGNRLGDSLSSRYETKQMQVDAEDMVVWYTDGIVEGEDLRGEEYGERRFRAMLRRSANLGPGALRDEIVERTAEFFGEIPPKDDITLVVGKIA